MDKKSLKKKSQDKQSKSLVPNDSQDKELERVKEFLDDPENKSKVLKDVYIQQIPLDARNLLDGAELTFEGTKFFSIVRVVQKALIDEKTQDNTVAKILTEVIFGAYQDRQVCYAISSDNTFDKLERVQRLRQSADNHLLRVIQASKNFKRPPVKVIVKKTDQVNLADKQVNVSQAVKEDKQINVSQAEGSPSDLDRKNEKIS